MVGIVQDIVFVGFGEKPFAEGGEKKVYRGFCLSYGWVVIKTPSKPKDPVARKAFSVEVERASKLKGDNLTEIIAYDLESDPPYYVERYYPDGTLAEKMKGIFDDDKVFNEGAAVGYCRQILVALQHMHSQGQIHRDVKPSNILYDAKTKKLVLGDMGLGRTFARATHLQTSFFKGTTGYASPEQVRGSKVDHRTDLYSVGVILHEMLTGEEMGSFSRVTYSKNQKVKNLVVKLTANSSVNRFSSAEEAVQFIDKLEISTR